MTDIKNILVAVDFHDAVGELLSTAESIAEKYDAKIWVVHVAEEGSDYTGFEGKAQYIKDTRKEEFREEHQYLQTICNTFLGEEVEKEALLIPGPTVETVLEEAKKLNSDLLVVGTHKHSFLHNLLRESVSRKLLKNANIPLLAVPMDEE